MVAIVAALALLATLSWGFWAMVRRFGPAEMSFWHAFAVLFAAKHAARFAIAAFADLDALSKVGVSLLVYITVLTCDLAVLAKLPVRRAAALSIAYAVIATTLSFLVVTYFFPAAAPSISK